MYKLALGECARLEPEMLESFSICRLFTAITLDKVTKAVTVDWK